MLPIRAPDASSISPASQVSTPKRLKADLQQKAPVHGVVRSFTPALHTALIQVSVDNTSKAAANHLTTQLAVTLGPRKITVNAILPGIFPSKMTAFGIQKGGAAMAASYPMGRIGTPEDIAGTSLVN